MSAREKEDSDRHNYLRTKAFLQPFGLTPFEAQLLLEIRGFRQPHVDIRTLSKRIPKIFGTKNLGYTIKDLILRDCVARYPPKKDEFCVCLAPFGRSFVTQAIRQGFHEFIDQMPMWEKRFGTAKTPCYDPQGFKKGDIRYANGPLGKIRTEVLQILTSTEIFSTGDDGKAIYRIRLVGKAQCPRCSNEIGFDYSYDHVSCYQKFNRLPCSQCGIRLMLRCCLSKYYLA